MPNRTRGLPQGGSSGIDRAEAARLGAEWARATLERTGAAEPVAVEPARADYSAGYNSTTGVPSGPLAGVATAYGRCWAEARSITCGGGTGPSLQVVLLATQNGVRATVIAPVGQTIAGGSVRFWWLDPVTQIWSLGNVDETLPTGTRSASTSDQFSPVGGK